MFNNAHVLLPPAFTYNDLFCNLHIEDIKQSEHVCRGQECEPKVMNFERHRGDDDVIQLNYELNYELS